MTLDRLRKEIDRIDLQVLRLLNRRALVARRIGELKRKQGLPIFDAKREGTVLSRMSRANQGPLPESAIQGIFLRILRENRRLQKKGAARAR